MLDVKQCYDDSGSSTSLSLIDDIRRIISNPALIILYELINFVRTKISLDRLTIDPLLEKYTYEKFNNICYNTTADTTLPDDKDIVSNVSIYNNVTESSMVGIVGMGIWYDELYDCINTDDMCYINSNTYMFKDNLTHIGCTLSWCDTRNKYILICSFKSYNQFNDISYSVISSLKEMMSKYEEFHHHIDIKV